MEDTRLFPNECREGRHSYEGALQVTLSRKMDGGVSQDVVLRCGSTPIMVRSARCHLASLGPQELIAHREEEREMGGYFIVNGNEKCMRLLILPLRNFVTALVRPSFVNRGRDYTRFATTVRCVRDDQTAQSVTLHYLSNGGVTLRLALLKQEFFVPVTLLLHALLPTSDREIFAAVLSSPLCTDDADAEKFVADRMELMLRETRRLQLRKRRHFLAHLGSRFRSVMRAAASQDDVEVGQMLLDRHLLVHCTNAQQKFDVLVLMLQKLFALVQGSISADHVDALHLHESLLPGHLYLALLKERVQELLYFLRQRVEIDERRNIGKTLMLSSDSMIRNAVSRDYDIGQRMSYLMSTGNLVSTTGLDLQQTAGFTIVAEKLNFYRYMSHFRAIHRGAFFTEMKTTAVRKLLPESWGFVCPVHTPDGSPCGLLNHLSATCRLLCVAPPATELQALHTALGELGLLSGAVVRAMNSSGHKQRRRHLPVLLNGVPLGVVEASAARTVERALRRHKVNGRVPPHLEVTVVTSVDDGTFPGIFLSTSLARFTRPVLQLASRRVEWISPLEQVFLDIAVKSTEIREGETTHLELSPTNMLSAIASLTPFSDFNQSPRNMYQCQMGKQTMGTPYHSHPHRCDNKVYRLQTPQTPLVRNEAAYDGLHADDYPLGCNAVVAVVSYTGYDMEDAMIINKSAFERGFGHGSVYVTKIIDLNDLRTGNNRDAVRHRFCNVKPGTRNELFVDSLPADGLPRIGTFVQQGDPLYAVLDEVSGVLKATRHKLQEPAYVEEVRLLGAAGTTKRHFLTTSSAYQMAGNGPLQVVSLKLRYERKPVIGDKFSSRHGQKGVLSQLWPQTDMPFSEQGISPDVIINPHAFPSRMTIGMLIESMAGKASAMSGLFADGTPFRFNEDEGAVDFFGRQLRQHGFAYLGNECLYSGVSGRAFEADVFQGLVYYQRLRHMVSDKFQVRATGPTNALTHQPVHGRKHGGGIRFGEMERDSLLGHGAAFLLRDRLFRCSDYHTALVCTRCGAVQDRSRCRSCEAACRRVPLPYVFTYLLAELASMNIKVHLRLDALPPVRDLLQQQQ